jgi:uncharacterized protein (TIGR02145 family)
MESSFLSRLILVLLILIFSNSCKNEEVPTVTTTEITGITDTSAISGGTITSEGTSIIHTKGVCWSTEEDPTIVNDTTDNGTGTLTFTSNITGLNVATMYYVRAYASNSVGTGYGMAKSFTTVILDIEGHGYHEVTIGTQTWLVENLKTTKYNNGDAIPYVTDDTEWNTLTYGGYCNCNNFSGHVNPYGRLYNWYAVSDNRNLCPTGWHVPEDSEWTTLINYLGGQDIAGAKLKERGTTHWDSPNADATNESGFSALPGGHRYTTGGFAYFGYNGTWWSSTDAGSTVENIILTSTNSTVHLNNFPKSEGSSVRCIKD